MTISPKTTPTTAAVKTDAEATIKTTTDSVIDALDSFDAEKARAALIEAVEHVRNDAPSLVEDKKKVGEVVDACEQFLRGKTSTTLGLRGVLGRYGTSAGATLGEGLRELEPPPGKAKAASRVDTPKIEQQPAPRLDHGDALVTAHPAKEVVANPTQEQQPDNSIVIVKVIGEVAEMDCATEMPPPRSPGDDVDDVGGVQPPLWNDEDQRHEADVQPLSTAPATGTDEAEGAEGDGPRDNAVVEEPPPIAPPAESSLEAVSAAVVDDSELAELDRLTVFIQQRLRAFLEAGDALAVILNRQLYKARGFSSFESYVKTTFDLSRRRAYQLVTASGVVDGLRGKSVNNCTQMRLPENECQIRMLAKVHPERRTEVWQAVQEKMGGGKITAKTISQMAKTIGALPQETAGKRKADAGSSTSAAECASKAVAALIEAMPVDMSLKDRMAACNEAVRLIQEELDRLGQGRMLGETSASAGSVEAPVEEQSARRRPGVRASGGVGRSGRSQRKHASCV